MRIAVLDDYQNVALKVADWSRLQDRCTIDVFNKPVPMEIAAQVLAPYEILCTLRERMKIPAELIRVLPNLKYIVVTGRRYDTVDVAAAAKRAIPVSNTEVRGGGGVAELVWGLILACARSIPFEDRMMRQGGWQNTIGLTLRGRTLGLLGFGNLGQQVARIGRAFGMKIIAWSPNLTADRAAAGDAILVSKQDLFRQSDVLSLHLVLGPGTIGIVRAEDMNLMKSDAILINTARGPLVDEDALVDALRSNRIGGAGLDVFDTEPLTVDHPLRGLDNVVLTPHLGYYTREMISSYYEDAIDAITAFLDGAPINVVNGVVRS